MLGGRLPLHDVSVKDGEFVRKLGSAKGCSVVNNHHVPYSSGNLGRLAPVFTHIQIIVVGYCICPIISH